MRLLLLVLLVFSATYAGRAVFTCAQQEVIQKLKDDATGFDKRVAQLIEILKGPAVEEATPQETINGPSTQPNENKTEAAKDKTNASNPVQNIAKTATPNNEQLKNITQNLEDIRGTSLADFNQHLITDLFPNISTKEFFDKVYALMSNEVQKAVDKCVSEKKCQHPFPKLADMKKQDPNIFQSIFQSTIASYWDRPNQQQVRREIVSLLDATDIPEKLRYLKSTIHYELPSIDAASIPFISDIPPNLSLSSTFLAEVEDVKIPHKPEISKTLHDLSGVLRAARSALAACKVVVNRKGVPGCSSGDVPLDFLLDPSKMKAFDDMVAAYDARVDEKVDQSKQA